MLISLSKDDLKYASLLIILCYTFFIAICNPSSDLPSKTLPKDPSPRQCRQLQVQFLIFLIMSIYENLNKRCQAISYIIRFYRMIHGKKKEEKTKSEEQIKRENELSNQISTKLGQFFKIRKQPIEKNNIEKLVQFTTILMQLCADITTIYNYRRQLIQKLLEGAEDPKQKAKIIGGEIKLITKIIQDDPKSYTLWSYRQWLVLVLYELDKSILIKEKGLCEMLLQKDQKNFHVWNYRNWANSISMNIDEELAFTDKKIKKNPFSFSPYHFRSKHILKKYSQQINEENRKQILTYGMPKQVFDGELQMVKTAIFINPKQEAPWLYHSWILKQLIPSLFLKQQGKKLLFSLKVSNISNLIQNNKKVNASSSPSDIWQLQEDQNIKVCSNEQKQSNIKIETTGKRVIGSDKFDQTEILKIFQAEQAFLMEVIESQETKYRFAWQQILEINKNILYLGTKPQKWNQIVQKSIKIFENLQDQTKGMKYIEKQKAYWERLLTQDLSDIEKELKHYRK